MNRYSLTVDQALRAIRAFGLTYVCDPDPSRWTATCPGCRRRGSLILTEARRDGPVALGCRNRCRPPNELAAMLSVDPDVIAAQVEARRWRTTAEWAIDFARRQLAREFEAEAA